MSADAKAWQEDNGDWHVLHDGPCTRRHDEYGPYDLSGLIADVEVCLDDGRLRWELRTYPDGKAGLVGFRA